MKITHVTTRVLSTPADNPLVVGLPAPTDTREFVTLELGTDQGLVGIGVTFFGGGPDPGPQGRGRHAGPPRGRRRSHPGRGHRGQAAARVRAARARAGSSRWPCPPSTWRAGTSRARRSASPCARCSAACATARPTYASGALMRPHPVDYLAKAGPRLVGMGFRQMKMQCGSEPTVAASVERVRVMREAIGPDIDLMCDINQLWSVNQAIEVGRRIEPYHLFWLEDPTAHDDYPGLARVADALTTPIAAGEYHYGIVPFRHLLEARSIDIVMIDLLRVGGITQWMKVAGMAEAFNLPVVSHLVPEIHVHLVAAIPNGLTVEYMPWSLRLFEETPAARERVSSWCRRSRASAWPSTRRRSSAIRVKRSSMSDRAARAPFPGSTAPGRQQHRSPAKLTGVSVRCYGFACEPRTS